MRVLGIETATSLASVGVLAGAELIERRGGDASSHGRELIPLIDVVLSLAGLDSSDLDLIAVSVGPGSFTGLRIGLSVAKGLAIAWRLPIVGVPTLDAYAAAIGPRSGAIWPVLDARKGEVYAAGYRWLGDTMRCFMPPRAIDADAFAYHLESPCLVVGDGVDAFSGRWVAAGAGPLEMRSLSEAPPSGAVVAREGASRFASQGADDWARLEPLYCRRPDAERRRSAYLSDNRREN